MSVPSCACPTAAQCQREAFAFGHHRRTVPSTDPDARPTVPRPELWVKESPPPVHKTRDVILIARTNIKRNKLTVEVIGSEVGREIHDAAEPAVPFNFTPARDMNRGTRRVFSAY